MGIRRLALLSVYDKTGIGKFAQALLDRGFDLLASGGTARVLSEAGIPVTDVAEWVGGSATEGHRVVTLSREIHTAILSPSIEEVEAMGLRRIDLVCVNLYPLEEEIAKPGSTRASVIAKTDIGGPTMLSSAAKAGRIVISSPCRYQAVLNWMDAGEPDRDEFVNALRVEADALVAEYRLASARYHSNGGYEGVIGRRLLNCVYGENRCQVPAWLYSIRTDDPLAIDRFVQVAGGQPSYNGLTDIDRLLQTITHIAAGFEKLKWAGTPAIAVAVKHGNPCGAGVDDAKIGAINKVVSGDPLAILGGVVMTNFRLDRNLSKRLLSHGDVSGKTRLIDVIIAPSFTENAVEILSSRAKCRLFANPALANIDINSLDHTPIFRPVRGGFLVQPNYTYVFDFWAEELACWGSMSDNQAINMVLAWAIAATSNSNTIALDKDGMLIGNGVGQQDRVGAANLAVFRAMRSIYDVRGAVAASDSFFPFVDGPQVLVEAGVAAILTTSGSRNDEDVIKYILSNNVALRMVPDAIGRGFYRH